MSPDKVVAVTNRTLCARPFLDQAERVCRFRPAAFILREKDLPEPDYEALAADVLALCQRYAVPCILHSFPDAAARLGVKQLHLPLWRLEELAGPALARFETVGASVHSVEEAVRAQALGASYVTAGHIYATDCKKGLPPRGLGFLRSVCAGVSIPVYAIGGIRLEERQIEEVLRCGAAKACVMSGMMAL